MAENRKTIWTAKLMTLAALCVAAPVSFATEGDNACLEGATEQFGRYVGDWKITDQQFAKDGSGWNPGKGARWIFECIGDGKAVQDYWMPNGGGWGTNLRTYNADSDQWEIVWAAAALNGFTHINATQDAAGNIKMNIVKPEQDPPRRITFMPPDENGWDWVMEMSFDGGENWTAVYKIRATPWSEK